MPKPAAEKIAAGQVEAEMASALRRLPRAVFEESRKRGDE